jgi:hypothetical protein
MSERIDIDRFQTELQQFLNAREASIFFGEHHAEVWANGERIGALTHSDAAELERFECDC